MPELIVIDEGRTCPDAAAFNRRLGRTAEAAVRGHRVPGRSAIAVRIGRTIWGGAAECMMKPYDAEICSDSSSGRPESSVSSVTKARRGHDAARQSPKSTNRDSGGVS